MNRRGRGRPRYSQPGGRRYISALYAYAGMGARKGVWAFRQQRYAALRGRDR